MSIHESAAKCIARRFLLSESDQSDKVKKLYYGNLLCYNKLNMVTYAKESEFKRDSCAWVKTLFLQNSKLPLLQVGVLEFHSNNDITLIFPIHIYLMIHHNNQPKIFLINNVDTLNHHF